MRKLNCLFIIPCILFARFTGAQPLNTKTEFNHQDSLRGTNGPERIWWDVCHYDIKVTPDYGSKSIHAETTVTYLVTQSNHSDYMQIDLQQPLKIDTLYYDHKPYVNDPSKPFYNEGNVWHIPLPKEAQGSEHTLTIVYHGRPKEAINPPWDGGWIWKKDSQGRPWMTVACQGLGASVWYPCKDYQGDEPDKGATLTIIIPDTLVAVGNGRLKQKSLSNGMVSYTWEVINPINNYDIVPYIGKYTNWTDTLHGEKGKLDLSYWVLEEDLTKAKKQFEEVKPMLRAFEYWFGPYPFYEDSYKLVEAPHLGMEHQSAVAYGNHFQEGYLGRDLSGTGWGMKWDYIIVHESGHEWFGNNITSKDIADMWVHEGFTDYSETLYIDYYFGKNAANEYVQGLRRNIQNDKPIIGPYGVNKEGSGDMYFKGANIIHTIRQLINNDNKFRQILRGLNQTFYHQTVTTKQIEDYISEHSGLDLKKFFDQYLRTIQIPVLEIKSDGTAVSYRWSNCIAGFNMPIRLNDGTWIHPSQSWQQASKPFSAADVNPNFYITFKKA